MRVLATDWSDVAKISSLSRSYALFGAVILLLSSAVIWYTVAHNAIGRNVTVTVECGNGEPVVGAFVEAKTLPRVPGFGWEVNSGWAKVRVLEPRSRATVRYWLPLGGRASVHFGCQLLDGTVDEWGTDNRTPFFDADVASWVCDGPKNTTPPTVVVTGCKRLGI